ncbi:hypothetical protein EYC80_000479 [Monilinia laxa]|uniref:Uncharacterized protein n=1 Tax=Monilinia laxa TaxID=61186 RepID=A0A5N6KBX3_MONLA|nr:hypothetical protein EYC80_000479 [Monilinia laxa]
MPDIETSTVERRNVVKNELTVEEYTFNIYCLFLVEERLHLDSDWSLRVTGCAAATLATQKMNDGCSNKARCCEPDECRTSLGFLTSGFQIVKRSLSTRVGLAGPGDEWVAMIT